MKTVECDCNHCKQMCYGRSCWGTITQIKKIIDAGYGNKLMLDYYSFNDRNIDILVPAMVGYEEGRAPFWPEGKCSMLDKNDLCILHDKGLKPIEGKLASCKNTDNFIDHENFAKHWDTIRGQYLIENWCKTYF